MFSLLDRNQILENPLGREDENAKITNLHLEVLLLKLLANMGFIRLLSHEDVLRELMQL